MVKSCLVGLLLVGLVAFGICNAEETLENRWSVGASLGTSRFQIDADPDAIFYTNPAPTSAESKSSLKSLRAGIDLTRRLSLQLEYSDFGDVGYAKQFRCGQGCFSLPIFPIFGNFHARGIGVTAIGSLPLGRQWDLLGGIGASLVIYRNEAAAVPSPLGHPAIDRSSHRVAPAAFLGFRWRITGRISTRIALGGSWNVSDTDTTGRADLYALSIGVDYHFGRR